MIKYSSLKNSLWQKPCKKKTTQNRPTQQNIHWYHKSTEGKNNTQNFLNLNLYFSYDS